MMVTNMAGRKALPFEEPRRRRRPGDRPAAATVDRPDPSSASRGAPGRYRSRRRPRGCQEARRDAVAVPQHDQPPAAPPGAVGRGAAEHLADERDVLGALQGLGHGADDLGRGVAVLVLDGLVGPSSEQLRDAGRVPLHARAVQGAAGDPVGVHPGAGGEELRYGRRVPEPRRKEQGGVVVPVSDLGVGPGSHKARDDVRLAGPGGSVEGGLYPPAAPEVDVDRLDQGADRADVSSLGGSVKVRAVGHSLMAVAYARDDTLIFVEVGW